MLLDFLPSAHPGLLEETMKSQMLAALLVALLPFSAPAKPFPDPHAPARAAAWVGAASVVMHVRWVRTFEHPQSEVRDGVCVLYMADRDEDSLTVAEALVSRCLQGKLAVVSPAPADTVLLHWHMVDSPEAIDRMRRELYPSERPERNAGYYFHPDPTGPCHVITNVNRKALGHELKHCFDGEFHNSVPGQFGGRAYFWRKK
jgi:hypothetical protein